MAGLPKLTPPETLGAAIAPIAVLADDEFDKLLESTSTRRSFQVRPKIAKKLADDIPALSAVLPFTLGALTFLYNKLAPHRDKNSLTSIVSQLIADLDVKCSTDDRPKLEKRLSLLLARNESFDIARKLQRLEKGFLPNATGFRSFVDLRPDFGGEDALQFNGLVKIVQFRISTDAGAKKSREFVFQLSEEALEELQQAIDRAKAKLRALDDVSSISGLLVNRAST